MDFIELSSESSQLTHDLNKATSSLSMLEIYAIFFLQFLLELGV